MVGLGRYAPAVLAEREAEAEPLTSVEVEVEGGEADVDGTVPCRANVEPEPALLGGAGALRCGTRVISEKSRLPVRPVKAPSVPPIPSTPLR